MPSGRIVFYNDSHAPGEPIHMQMVVDGVTPPAEVTFTGTYTVNTVQGTASGTTQVGDVVDYGQVTAPGYDVVQDLVDPSRYTATPTAG